MKVKLKKVKGVKSLPPWRQGKVFGPEPNPPKLPFMNPKGGELLLIIVKSEETQMEANMHSDAQIDAMN